MAATGPIDYVFDAFISYSHSPVIKPWVNNFFYPHFESWLTQFMGGELARVFLDKDGIRPGQRWPQRLRDALLTSKCLVPVYSGDYFFKIWCFSEWSNFVKRENVLGLNGTAESLILPIIHNDGQYFPGKAMEYQTFDFKDCRTTSGNFQNHANFPVFEGKVERLAQAVAQTVRRAPPFDPGWPVAEIDPPATPIVPLMRIS